MGKRYFVPITSGGARGHPNRGSSFPDRGAEVSAGITLPCKLPPPLLRRTTYTVRPGGRPGPHALYLIGTSASLIMYTAVSKSDSRVYGAAAAVVGTRSIQPSMGV